MLKEIFQIISFYDDARWKSVANYNLINFYKKDICDDAKLLTHWLCYISDRQMPFERIWEVGGFVFSELADKFYENGNLSLLNPDTPNSFIVSNNGGYNFRSNSIADDNQILRKTYSYKKTDKITFTPRYYPSDYFSILFTFDILREYNNSLTKYIAEIINRFKKSDDLIKRILFSLYLLTYYRIGQPTKKEIKNFSKNLEKAKKRTNEVKSTLRNNFEEEFENFKKDAIFKQKRAWCSLRDFFKSPEFRKYFSNALQKENINPEEIELFSLKSLKQFELPGDVWNNNSKFKNCILEGTDYENSKDSLNKILRDFYEKNKNDLGTSYPEQFDITFDFVPRMCEKDNCDICPIGTIKKKNSNFNKTCINNKKYYCPVALSNCNYKIDCLGDECKLLKVTNNKNGQLKIKADN